ncbi:MAG TPA: heme lyase CcmF/NrfE family subunit [Thermodesulfobacteriota bacterium]
MISTLGTVTLTTALVIAIYAAVASVLGARTGRPALVASAENGVLTVFGLVALAVALMEWALVGGDYSIAFVANNSSRATPLIYKITGLWGALEGSILLWLFVLGLFAVGVVLTYRRDPRPTMRALLPYATAVLMAVVSFFLLVTVVPANPFAPFPGGVVPPDGRGLNPLLQNPGMAGHPPMLYLGFTGFTVPFAFAMAALVTGRLDRDWIVATRKWTVAAWWCLTAGILLGGWWAYHVLGWGGIWAWDPVENASFLPWLTGTAFLHSVMIQERRGMLKVWNIVLIILTFALTLFGTFLTRSGILASVHAFTTSDIGYYFLAAVAVTLVGALWLVAARGDRLRSEATLDSMVSRESVFLMNNVFLVGSCFSVFLGTVFPLIAEALRGVKISVGAPFFNSVNVPIAVGLVVLMGIGPLIAWRRASLAQLRRHFLWPAVAGVATAAVLFALGVRGGWALAAFASSVFVAVVVGAEFVRVARARAVSTGEPFVKALAEIARRNRRRYGGLVVHLGIVFIVIGITASFGFQRSREVALARGEAVEFEGYRIEYTGLVHEQEPHRLVIGARLDVSRDGRSLGTYVPAKNFYEGRQEPTTTVAVRERPSHDLYLILGDVAPDGSHVTIRMLLNPLVMWIWIGGVVLTLGTVLAVFPDRKPAHAVAPAALGQLGAVARGRPE